jgi:hypothetical protein
MPGLCLSRTEVAELTRERTRARQLAFLRANGIRHYIDIGGWPVVLRATVEGQQAQAQDVQPAWKPNKAA